MNVKKLISYLSSFPEELQNIEVKSEGPGNLPIQSFGFGGIDKNGNPYLTPSAEGHIYPENDGKRILEELNKAKEEEAERYALAEKTHELMLKHDIKDLKSEYHLVFWFSALKFFEFFDEYSSARSSCRGSPWLIADTVPLDKKIEAVNNYKRYIKSLSASPDSMRYTRYIGFGDGSYRWIEGKFFIEDITVSYDPDAQTFTFRTETLWKPSQLSDSGNDGIHKGRKPYNIREFSKWSICIRKDDVDKGNKGNNENKGNKGDNENKGNKGDNGDNGNDGDNGDRGVNKDIKWFLRMVGGENDIPGPVDKDVAG